MVVTLSAIARLCPPACTVKASDTTTVSGSLSRKRVPVPGSVSTSIYPLSRVTFVRTTSMPTPRPAAVVTTGAVLNPGKNTRFSA